MARIELSPELLHSPIAKVNVCNFYNPLEELSCALDDAYEREFEDYFLRHGEEPEDVFINAREFYKKAMSYWGDFLADRFDELFGGNGPVMVWGPGEIYFDDGGWGHARDGYIMRWFVNGEALYKLAESYGITSVDDGHDISGFVRTCSDADWARHRVIAELMEAMSDTIFEDILEYFQEDAYEHVEVQFENTVA